MYFLTTNILCSLNCPIGILLGFKYFNKTVKQFQYIPFECLEDVKHFIVLKGFSSIPFALPLSGARVKYILFIFSKTRKNWLNGRIALTRGAAFYQITKFAYWLKWNFYCSSNICYSIINSFQQSFPNFMHWKTIDLLVIVQAWRIREFENPDAHQSLKLPCGCSRASKKLFKSDRFEMTCRA